MKVEMREGIKKMTTTLHDAITWDEVCEQITNLQSGVTVTISTNPGDMYVTYDWSQIRNAWNNPNFIREVNDEMVEE